MKLVILGTDHELQERNLQLKDRLTELVGTHSVALIGEEFTGNSLAKKLAQEIGIPWIGIDMSQDEKENAGLGSVSASRFDFRRNQNIPENIAIYAPTLDSIREQFWLDRLESQNPIGVVLAVCGAVHVRPLRTKAQKRGHETYCLFWPEELADLEVVELPSCGNQPDIGELRE